MLKDKDFVLHLLGLIVLSALAVFFGILEAKFSKEFIDIGIVIGIIGSLVGIHTANSVGTITNKKNRES